MVGGHGQGDGGMDGRLGKSVLGLVFLERICYM